jgi:hypothetical protein
MFSRILIRFEFVVFALVIGMLFSGSTLMVDNQIGQIRSFTRAVEFDYFDWTLGAIEVKLGQATLDTPYYFDATNQHQIVVDYFKLTDEIIQQEYQLRLMFTDPNIKDPVLVSREQRAQIEKLYESQRALASIAEAVLEQQTREVLNDQGLTVAGQPIPPVLFHITPLPYNLIISPRDKIQQDDSISLVADLAVNVQVDLEKKIDTALNVSSLVVPVGGIGSYPTMIERSTSLKWLSNTIAHEWIHNWLGLRPLGNKYESSNELRTMNETTASIAGDEIGRLVIQKFYPELEAEIGGYQLVSFPSSHPDPNDLPIVQFDFRAEMHKTRVRVDELLVNGKIEEAESYMESRRQVFWDNGYAIRKLNQAYFAFYGAYADVPGGAAGEDPVGPAVRALRAQSPTLLVFLKKISQMTSFDELKAAVSK